MLKEYRFKTELEGEPYPEPGGVYKLLKQRFREEISIAKLVVSDEPAKEAKDHCILKVTWHLENSNKDVDIYYGDESRIVTKVEWR